MPLRILLAAAAKPRLRVVAKKRVTVSAPCATACTVQATLVRRGRTLASERTTLVKKIRTR